MSILQSIFLGILQGVTEFLPVSSSGHLVVFRDVLGIDGIPLLYDVLLHAATLIVVVAVFRDQIMRLIFSLYLVLSRKASGDRKEICRRDMRTILTIVIATFWTGGIGMAISGIQSDIPVRMVYVLFLVTAAILILGKVINAGAQTGDISPMKSSIIGISQGLAVLPGISRSGMTISTALMCGVDRKRAGEISFLITIPAILGALFLELIKGPEISASVSMPAVAAGCIAALITGFLALKLLLYLLRGGKLYLFSIYLIPLGIYGLLFRA